MWPPYPLQAKNHTVLEIKIHYSGMIALTSIIMRLVWYNLRPAKRKSPTPLNARDLGRVFHGANWQDGESGEGYVFPGFCLWDRFFIIGVTPTCFVISAVAAY